jgi:hypothetical protein
MPLNSSSIKAWIIEDKNTKSCSPPPVSSLGKGMILGKALGACKIARPLFRPKASLPVKEIIKFKLLFNMRGNGCAESRPTGVNMGCNSS